jgi:hypothetical protein
MHYLESDALIKPLVDIEEKSTHYVAGYGILVKFSIQFLTAITGTMAPDKVTVNKRKVLKLTKYMLPAGKYITLMIVIKFQFR